MKTTIGKIVWLLLVLAVLQHGQAQAADVGAPVSLRNTETHLLYSEELQQHYLIDVFLPARHQKKTSDQQFTRHPVIYVLDSRPNAIITASQRNVGGMAFEIIVGIDYADENGKPVDSFSAYSRDLTPTPDKTWQTPDTGRADAFLDFINKSVKPLINSTYNVNTNDQTLVGHSFGGLFGLYVLFNHSDDFDRYVISSPSIWWNDRVTFRFEEQYAKTHSNMAKHVFISVGQREFLRGPQGMVENTQQMVEILTSRNYSGLTLKHHVFANENHATVVGLSLARGVRAVFQ